VARPLAWGDTVVNVALTDAINMTPLNLLANLTAADTITTMRIVGHLYVRIQNHDLNVSSTQAVDLGIGVSAPEAFIANVLPDPNQDLESPARGWLWTDRLLTSFSNSSTFGIELYERAEVRFDIRSSRKVDKGVLYLNGLSSNIDNSPMTTRLTGRIRVLCAT